MIITEIQYFFSKIIRFQAIFKDTVEFTCALEFKISSQPFSRKISRHLSSFNCSLLIFHYSIHIRMRLKSSSGNPTALPPVFSHHILSEIFKNKECLRHVTSWYFSSSPFPTIRCARSVVRCFRHFLFCLLLP